MQAMTILLAGFVLAAPNDPNSQEELSVERAARQFRIHVYEAFHTDRPTYPEWLVPLPA